MKKTLEWGFTAAFFSSLLSPTVLICTSPPFVENFNVKFVRGVSVALVLAVAAGSVSGAASLCSLCSLLCFFSLCFSLCFSLSLSFFFFFDLSFLSFLCDFSFSLSLSFCFSFSFSFSTGLESKVKTSELAGFGGETCGGGESDGMGISGEGDRDGTER